MSETNEGFGIYDTKDGTWIGTSERPLVYVEEEMAKIAARIMDYRLGVPAGRLRARRFDPGVNKKKEDLETKMTAEKALKLLESGHVI